MSSLLWIRRGLAAVVYALALAPYAAPAMRLSWWSEPLALGVASVATMGAIGMVVPRLWAQLLARASLALVAIFGAVVALSGPMTLAAGSGWFTCLAACGSLGLLGSSGVGEAHASPSFAPIAGRTSFLLATVTVMANAMVLSLLAAVDLSLRDYGPAVLSFSTAAAGVVSVIALLRMRAASVWLSAGAATMLLLACLATSQLALSMGPFGGHQPMLHLTLWAIAAVGFSTIGASLFDARLAFRRRQAAEPLATTLGGTSATRWRVSTSPTGPSRHDLEDDLVVNMVEGQRVGPSA